jgi:hypothetical protein
MPLITTYDTISRIYQYLDAREACAANCINKSWAYVASVSDFHWKRLCQILWEGKQNHPLERWAFLKPRKTSFDQCENGPLSDEQIRYLTTRVNSLEQCLRKMYPQYPENGDMLSFESVEQFKSFKAYINEIESINYRLKEADHIKQFEKIDYSANKNIPAVDSTFIEYAAYANSLISSHTDKDQTCTRPKCRIYAPLSRIPIIEKIRLEQVLYRKNI